MHSQNSNDYTHRLEYINLKTAYKIQEDGSYKPDFQTIHNGNGYHSNRLTANLAS